MTEPEESAFILHDDDGIPTAAVDLRAVKTAGGILAARTILALLDDDGPEAERLTLEPLTVDGGALILLVALQQATALLAGMLPVVESLGLPVRERLEEVRDGREADDSWRPDDDRIRTVLASQRRPQTPRRRKRR